MAAMDAEALAVDVSYAGWLEKKGGMRWSKRYFEVLFNKNLTFDAIPTPTLGSNQNRSSSL